MSKGDKVIKDSETGIRNMNVIKRLPVNELTDDEICKLFFKRFDAEALVMVYVDRQGTYRSFGRLYERSKAFKFYRTLLANLSDAGFLTDHDSIDDPESDFN